MLAWSLDGRRAFLRTAGAAAVLALVGTGAPVKAAQSDTRTIVIPVEGMACVACAASVKRALKGIDGVAAVEVSLATRGARVTYMPAKVTPEALVAAVARLGYRAGTPREVE